MKTKSKVHSTARRLAPLSVCGAQTALNISTP
jgi:hypothetical protein